MLFCSCPKQKQIKRRQCLRKIALLHLSVKLLCSFRRCCFLSASRKHTKGRKMMILLARGRFDACSCFFPHIFQNWGAFIFSEVKQNKSKNGSVFSRQRRLFAFYLVKLPYLPLAAWGRFLRN